MEVGDCVFRSCILCSYRLKYESSKQQMLATFVFLLVHLLAPEVHGQSVVTDHKVTLQTGTRGFLPCKVDVRVYAVIWNKGPKFEDSTNIVTLDMYNDIGQRFGSGYDDGSYNISDDFSLIINDVMVSSQGRYYCIVTPIESRVLSNHSDVFVFAQPNETFPTIEECKNNNHSLPSRGRSCQIFSPSPVNITCIVSGYYPSITLRFYHELSSGEVINMDEWNNADGTKYKFVTIRATPNDHPYICEASNIPGSENFVKELAKISVTLKSASPAAPESTAQSREDSLPVWAILVPVASIAIIGILLVVVYRLISRKREDSAAVTENDIELAIPLLNLQDQSQYSCVHHEGAPAVVKCIKCEKHLCKICINPTHRDHYLLSVAWEKEREDLGLPGNMQGNMNSLIGLKDGSLAVGYVNGGIDIINLETGETRHILGTKTVRYIDQFQDGKIVICDQERKFHVYNLDGEFVMTLIGEKETKCVVSLRVLANGNVLRGHSDMEEIREFRGSDGAQSNENMNRIAPFAPWQMIETSDSRLCVSSCQFGVPNPVVLLNDDGNHVSLMPNSSELCPFITHDGSGSGNIYIVSLSHARTVSIARYSEDGSKKEDIALGLPMTASIATYGNWMNITSLPNSRFVVADQERICFFRRRAGL